MYDMKIVNGTMISGAEGEQPWPGCVAVKDRRIAALGRDISGPARQTLDAAGQAVCPGFIDIHSDFIENMASPRPTSVIDFNISFFSKINFIGNNSILNKITSK